MSDAARGADDAGLSPKRDAACREFLRGLDDGHFDDLHASACRSCSERSALRRQLTSALRKRPVAPAALFSARIVESTFERIVDGVEASTAIGEWIGRLDAPAVQPSLEWPVPLLASPVGQLMACPPPTPQADVWAIVQRDLVAAFEARRSSAARVRLWIAGVSIAAAAALAFWFAPAGTKGSTAIVFVDLDRPPSADYPWLTGRR
jgi:hypothetical protein